MTEETNTDLLPLNDYPWLVRLYVHALTAGTTHNLFYKTEGEAASVFETAQAALVAAQEHKNDAPLTLHLSDSFGRLVIKTRDIEWVRLVCEGELQDRREAHLAAFTEAMAAAETRGRAAQ